MLIRLYVRYAYDLEAVQSGDVDTSLLTGFSIFFENKKLLLMLSLFPNIGCFEPCPGTGNTLSFIVSILCPVH